MAEKVLITGSAGFIGFSLVKKLLGFNIDILGIDNISDYYDQGLKFGRLKECGIATENLETGQELRSSSNANYRFIKLDITDREQMNELFRKEKFDKVCHLAAQPGVRYSLQNPYAYIDSNVSGFLNILEGCRHNNIKHLVFASSSSVYGANPKIPFNTEDSVDRPISLYAATKKSNELMAHCYSSLYDIPVTGLRFFTVYGPWGRPDMALFKFTKAILDDTPLDVYNFGNMKRDFTYVEDIIEGVFRVLQKQPDYTKEKAASLPPYRLYNIGNGKPVALMDFIKAIEVSLGKKAKLNLLPLQEGDVYETWADTQNLRQDYNFTPKTSVQEGVNKFVEWYNKYYS